MNSLPIELAIQILEWCDMQSVIQMSRTSRTMHELALSDHIWFPFVAETILKGTSIVKNALWIFDNWANPYTYIHTLDNTTYDRTILKSLRKYPADCYAHMKRLKSLYKQWTADIRSNFTISGHEDSVYCCQCDHDKLVSGSRDKTIRIWDWKTMEFDVLRGFFFLSFLNGASCLLNQCHLHQDMMLLSSAYAMTMSSSFLALQIRPSSSGTWKHDVLFIAFLLTVHPSLIYKWIHPSSLRVAKTTWLKYGTEEAGPYCDVWQDIRQLSMRFVCGKTRWQVLLVIVLLNCGIGKRVIW